MAAPQKNVENFLKSEGNTKEVIVPCSKDFDNTQESQDKVQSLSVEDITETLRSRIHEQSGLILILKQRADELLLRCQALKKANTELEGRVTDCQDELDGERQRADLLEKRFRDLAANNQAIIAFMNEYKNLNAQLKLENKELQSENETLFSQKLQDKEVFVQKLMQDIKLLAEMNTKKENDDREKLSGYQSKLLEQAAEHQTKEKSLLDQLHEAQQHQRYAEERCQDLKLKIQKAEEQHALKERGLRESIASLTTEKDKLLLLSMERGKIIQEKQKEIQLLETKWREEKQAHIEAEDRFKREAEAVNLDAKVKSLQSALVDSGKKYGKFKKDFEAFKEHSTNLLIQERELNKKLRHMVG